MTTGEQKFGGEPQPPLRPRDVIVPFRKRILFATALILTLILGDGVVGYVTEHAREESALQINMSGRQRMLSQRISGFSQILARPDQTSSEESKAIRIALRDAIELMESSHNALSNGNPRLDLPPPRGAIRDHYFIGDPSLDIDVRHFLDAAKTVVTSDTTNIDPFEASEYIRRAAFKPLLEKLDQAVTLYQRDAERQLTISTQVSFAMRAALLLSILGVMFGILWPMVGTIRRSLVQFVEERNRANAASQSKSEFLATVSHEIRTPMNSILGLSDLLAKTDKDVHLQRYAVLINESAKSLMSIVNDVLDLSKIEAGKLEVEHIAFSPSEIIDNTVGSFSSLAGDKGLELVISVADNVPQQVVGDPTRMRQILTNFVANAIKFTERGRVDINLYRHDTPPEPIDEEVFLRLEVRDTGIGFSEDKKAVIFEAFSQADQSTTRQYGGTGLGLAIAKRLTEAMGGSIDATSIPGQGSLFWVDLPFEPAADQVKGVNQLGLIEQGNRNTTETSADQTTKEHQSTIKVLVVDDNELNRIVLGAFLANGPYIISYACDGREAVEQACQTGFDLILMDAQMPVMGGVEALHAIRDTTGPSQHARIIVVTADALEKAENRYITAGFDGYLAKPITQETLARALGDLD